MSERGTPRPTAGSRLLGGALLWSIAVVVLLVLLYVRGQLGGVLTAAGGLIVASAGAAFLLGAHARRRSGRPPAFSTRTLVLSALAVVGGLAVAVVGFVSLAS